MLRGGTSRCLWLCGDGVISPMKKQEYKMSSNFYGKSNVNVIKMHSWCTTNLVMVLITPLEVIASQHMSDMEV
jgi:hypothetical protein